MKRIFWCVAIVIGLGVLQVRAGSPPPVGTWDAKVPGSSHQQLVFIFSPDQTFFSYGMTTESDGLFLVTGTWSVVGTELTGSFQQIDPPLTNDVFTLTGTAEAGKLQFAVHGPGPTFRVKCAPLAGTPSVIGDWSVDTLKGTNFATVISVTASNGLPHVFALAETAPTNNVTGVMMVNTKGQTLTFLSGGSFQVHQRGRFSSTEPTARFGGTDGRGKHVKQKWELLPP